MSLPTNNTQSEDTELFSKKNNWSLREDAPGGQLARQSIKVVTVTQTYLHCSCGESLYPPFPLEFL
jgi:hypothetical protein